MVLLALEEVDGENDGGREPEQGGVAGHGDREVIPGDGALGLEAKVLHQQHQQGSSEAESPAEHTPVSHPGEGGPVGRHTEDDAGDQQGSHTHPQQLGDEQHYQRHGGRCFTGECGIYTVIQY